MSVPLDPSKSYFTLARSLPTSLSTLLHLNPKSLLSGVLSLALWPLHLMFPLALHQFQTASYFLRLETSAYCLVP